MATHLAGPCDARQWTQRGTARRSALEARDFFPTCCLPRTNATASRPRADPGSESGGSSYTVAFPPETGSGGWEPRVRVRALESFPRFSSPQLPLSRPTPLVRAPSTGVRFDRAPKELLPRLGKVFENPQNVDSPKFSAPLPTLHPPATLHWAPNPRTFLRRAPRQTPASVFSRLTESPSSAGCQAGSSAVPRGG